MYKNRKRKIQLFIYKRIFSIHIFNENNNNNNSTIFKSKVPTL